MRSGMQWTARVVLLILLILLFFALIQSFRQGMRTSKKLIFIFLTLSITLVLCYSIAEVASLAILRARASSSNTEILTPFQLSVFQRESLQRLIDGDAEASSDHSAELGWEPVPNSTSKDGLSHCNSEGFRSRRPYSKIKPTDAIRAITFGDSFAFGLEVRDDETWQHQAETSAPALEVLNFGVPGYGMTQAYLMFLRRLAEYQTDYVVFGCMTADLLRSVNAYYPMRFKNPAIAPSAVGLPYASVDKHGKLVIHPNPLPDKPAMQALLDNPEREIRRLAKLDILFEMPMPTPLLRLLDETLPEESKERIASFWRYTMRTFYEILTLQVPARYSAKRPPDSQYIPGNRIYEANMQIFLEMTQACRSKGVTPIILWTPPAEDLIRYNDGKGKRYQRFLDAFQKAGILHFDTLDWFVDACDGKKLPIKEFFVNGHYSAHANKLIGQRMAKELLMHHAAIRAE
jgi:hypothetical protein